MLSKKNDPLVWLPLLIALLLLGAIYLFHLNRILFYAINSSSATFGGFWAHVTVFGDGLVVAVLLLPWLRKRPDILWAMLWTTLVFNIILHSMKSGFNLPRPPFVLPHDSFFIIGPAHNHHSFPSGHTATAFAFAGALAFGLKDKKMQTALFLAAVLVGLSRIGVGVHWPADVLAGLIVGWGSALIGWIIADRISIGRGLMFQMIIGPLLLAAAMVLVVDYDTKYPQTDWLRYVVGGMMLIWGGYEFVRIFIDRQKEKSRLRTLPG